MKSNFTEKKESDKPIHVEYVRNPGKGVAVKMEVDKDKIFSQHDFKAICDEIFAQNISHELAAWLDKNTRVPDQKEVEHIVFNGATKTTEEIKKCVIEALCKFLYLTVFEGANRKCAFDHAKEILEHIVNHD